MTFLKRVSARNPQPSALRLIFEYEGENVRLTSIQRVELVAPSADSPADGEQSGFWYELRDESGGVLYRRVTANPIRSSAEVLTEDEGRPLAREDMAVTQGAFVLVAPVLSEARTIALLASPPGIEGTDQAARLIATFDLPGENQEIPE
jgi:hypothetical protein